VPALRILCFGAAALSLGNLAAIVLMAVKRQNLLVPVALGSLALGAAGMISAIRMGFGIRGVAWVTLVTYALHSAVMVWLALGRLHENPTERLVTLTKFMTPLVVALPLAWGINRMLPHEPHFTLFSLVRLLGGMLAFLVVYGLLVRPLARGIGPSQVAAEFRLPWIARPRPAAGDAAS